MKIAAVVLAAGLSRRYGPENKLLQSLDGVPMIRRVVETIRGSKVDEIILVTGHQKEEVEAVLSGITDLHFVHNPEFEKGMSTSISVGAKSLGNIDACLICLGDLPHLKSQDYNQLIELFDQEKSLNRIMIPTFRGKKGHPVVFGSAFFDDLNNLTATDEGAWRVVLKHKSFVREVEMDTDRILTDIDHKDPQQSDNHGV